MKWLKQWLTKISLATEPDRALSKSHMERERRTRILVMEFRGSSL